MAKNAELAQRRASISRQEKGARMGGHYAMISLWGYDRHGVFLLPPQPVENTAQPCCPPHLFNSVVVRRTGRGLSLHRPITMMKLV